MGDVSRAVVRIGGLEYAIKGKESEEYIHKVAIYVDRKMKEIEKTNFNLSTSMLAVLVSLNLADDFLKLEEEAEELKEEIERLGKENESLNKQLLELKKENKKLKEATRQANAPIIYDVARANRSIKR